MTPTSCTVSIFLVSRRQTLTETVLGKPDDMLFTIGHVNEACILLLYKSGEFRLVQLDNNSTRFSIKSNKSLNNNIKKLFGRMFKLDAKKEFAFWKKSNNQIMKIQLQGKQKQDEIHYQCIKDKNDYLIDFEYDEFNENLYALSYHG